MDPTGNCSSYLPAMTSDITQMVFSMSHWSGDSLDWMQHDSCTGSCESNATQTFSNLRFYTTNINPPEPTNHDDNNSGDNSGSTEYTYGDPCNNLTDGLCGSVDCAECLYSWPSNSLLPDPWNDADAACRCKTENGQDNNEDSGDNSGSTEYTYGDACNNLNDGLCGSVDCAECLYSWPANSLLPDPWNDPDAACRCKTENGQDNNDNSAAVDYTYGDACNNLNDGLCGSVYRAECLYSWPSNSLLPDPWNDPDAACRCKTENGQDTNDNSGSTEYTYGDACNNLNDGFCASVDCGECLYSWPSNSLLPDPWNDPDAACRCKTENGQDNNDNSTPIDYTWGDACNNLNDGLCASVDCGECLYSWPSNSLLPDPWNDPDAACRCKTENGQDNNEDSDEDSAPVEYRWGDDCANLTDEFCGSVDCIQCLYSWPASSLLPDPWNDPDAGCRCKTERGQEIEDDSFPAITVMENGIEKTLYVQYPTWADADTNESSLNYNFNHRMYLSESQL